MPPQKKSVAKKSTKRWAPMCQPPKRPTSSLIPSSKLFHLPLQIHRLTLLLSAQKPPQTPPPPPHPPLPSPPSTSKPVNNETPSKPAPSKSRRPSQASLLTRSSPQKGTSSWRSRGRRHLRLRDWRDRFLNWRLWIWRRLLRVLRRLCKCAGCACLVRSRAHINE